MLTYSLAVVALVATAAQMSYAAPKTCSPRPDRPSFIEDEVKSFEHEGFTLTFLGYFEYTKDGQQMYLPLSLNEFSVGPGKRGVGPYTLTLDFDCGTMEIDEVSKTGDDRREVLYTIGRFSPAIEVESNVDSCNINSSPSNFKYTPEPYGGLEMMDERHSCWIEPSSSDPEQRHTVGNLVAKSMVLDNGSMWEEYRYVPDYD